MKKFPIVFALLTACYTVPGRVPSYDRLPLVNFDRVDDGVFRSAQPSAEELAMLVERYHIKTVVKLNSGGDEVPSGVAVEHFSMSVFFETDKSEVDRILDAIDHAARPVLIHCTHGEDRTGLIVALYRLRHGATLAEAHTDMMRHRFHPYRGLWRSWVHAVGWPEE